jgi:ATP-binding cassette subfamily B protein
VPDLIRFLSARLGRAARQLPRFPHALSLVWAAVALLIVQGLLPVAIVYLTRPLVDSVLAAIRSGGTFGPALVNASLMAGVLLASETLRSVESWVRTAQSELVRNHISQLVQRKSAAVDLGFTKLPTFSIICTARKRRPRMFRSP